MDKPNKFFLIKVTTNDEYFDNTAESAVVEFTPKLKAVILDAQKTVQELKTKHDHVYDLRIFDNSPYFLGFGDADEITGTMNIVDREVEFITEKEFSDAVKQADKNDIRMDTVIMHVSDVTVRWSAIYKHTSIEAETESIQISEI